MAANTLAQSALLESLIETLLCYNCNAVPGPSEQLKNQYNCIKRSHPLCESCKYKCDCGSKARVNILKLLGGLHYRQGLYVVLLIRNLGEQRKDFFFANLKDL